MLIGGLFGLGLAFVLGVVVYLSGHRIPMKSFFTVTGVIVIVFAAGLCSKVVLFLQASGDLGSFDMAFFNVTRYEMLTQSHEVGRFSAALVGWDPRPSIEQVAAWLAYFVPVTWLFLRGVVSARARTRVWTSGAAPGAASGDRTREGRDQTRLRGGVVD